MAAVPASGVDVDVIVVGGGFGGCYLLKLLRDQGLSVQLLEAGETLGGVWCWNRYPGARVDCEFPYYGFSDPAVWSSFTWTERFPDHRELRRYFQHVATVWNLEKDVHLNTQVTDAVWRDDRNTWAVTTRDGCTRSCRWFLAATGTSFRSYTPEWKGKESFKGELHHSAHWPEDLSLSGKRVAVVGSGSTGLQIMQEAGKLARSVTHYVRSPNIAVPLPQRPISEQEILGTRAHYPHIFKVCRGTITGLPVESRDRGIFDDTPEQREAVLEEQWRRGGFDWPAGSYNDMLVSEDANRAMFEFWLKKTRPRIKDPAKRDILAPREQPYFLGTKRMGFEIDYYEQCDKPHVAITTSPIREITATGIRSDDGSRDFDIIVVCTGFDAVDGGLRTMGIRGRRGIDLQEKWKDGIYTHLGMMVHDFPNMFMVYGPQAPSSFTAGPPFIELQCEWIAEVIARQQRERIAVVEAKASEEVAWRDHVLAVANMTLSVRADSWYMGANVPGKKREMLLYIGGIPSWHKAATEALENWKGFDLHGSGAASHAKI